MDLKPNYEDFKLLKEKLNKKGEELLLANLEIKRFKAREIQPHLNPNSTPTSGYINHLLRIGNSSVIKKENDPNSFKYIESIYHPQSTYNTSFNQTGPESLTNSQNELLSHLKNNSSGEFKLYNKISEQQKEIEDLKFSLSQKPKTHIVKAYTRPDSPPKPEIKYQVRTDPKLISENQKLGLEFQAAILEEQNAKNQYKEAMNEIQKLHNIIKELRARPPKIVERDKIITKKIEIPVRVGTRLEKLMNMYKFNHDKIVKRLTLDLLYYQRLFNKYRRISKENKEKIFINQKLEVVDGTYEVWDYMRSRMVKWLFEIFLRSVERASGRKK